MDRTDKTLEGDWLHGVFGVFRQEVISLSADFGQRVKSEIDGVADAQNIHPPSATALLTAVALETTNMAASLVTPDPDERPDPEQPGDADKEPEEPEG